MWVHWSIPGSMQTGNRRGCLENDPQQSGRKGAENQTPDWGCRVRRHESGNGSQDSSMIITYIVFGWCRGLSLTVFKNFTYTHISPPLDCFLAFKSDGQRQRAAATRVQFSKSPNMRAKLVTKL
jgi:hypothetical protein